MPAMRHARRRRQQQIVLGVLSLAALASLTSSIVRGEPASTSGESSEVLATFDKGQITLAEFERVIAQKTASDRALIEKPGGRQALLESMIRYDLLAQEAERRGYGTNHEVRNAERSVASETMLAASFRVDREKIPAEDIERAYAARKSEFGRPHMRRATHIRVATEAEAKALITELRGSDREGFARVAREKNIDPRTRNQGGELGYFDGDGKTESGRPTEVPIELVKATFTLKRMFDIAPKPIAQGGSWNVLMFTGEMPGISKKLEELDPIFREEIAVKQEERAVDAFVAELRSKTPIEVHPELIESIELPPHQPLDMPEGFAAAPPDPRAPPVILEPDGI